MATIEEQRRRLDAKLQEMADDGVLQGPSSATANFDPIDEERSVPEKTVLPAPSEQVAALRPLEEVSTIEEYRERYFVPLAYPREDLLYDECRDLGDSPQCLARPP